MGALIVGVGARRGVPASELDEAIEAALAGAGLSVDDVAVLATVDRRAAEPAFRELAALRGWALLGFTAGELAAVAVPHPSTTTERHTGTPSVAEAAAIKAGGALVAGKQTFTRVVVASAVIP